jgi:hypothetical protein
MPKGFPTPGTPAYRSAWRETIKAAEEATGLAALPDAEQSRNVILPEDAVLGIISAAYAR